MVNQQAEQLKKQNEGLKQALNRIIPWRDRLQRELRKEEFDHQETKKELEVKDTPEILWDELEAYFLIRGLTRENVKEIYGAEGNFRDYFLEKISSEDLKVSEKIFQTIIDIVSAKKILGTISDRSIDHESLICLQEIEESLSNLSKEEVTKDHPLYLEIIEEGSNFLEKIRDIQEKFPKQEGKIQAPTSFSTPF